MTMKDWLQLAAYFGFLLLMISVLYGFIVSVDKSKSNDNNYWEDWRNK